MKGCYVWVWVQWRWLLHDVRERCCVVVVCCCLLLFAVAVCCLTQWTKVLSGGALVVKSGSDFKDLSELVVTPAVHEGVPHHYDSGPMHHNVAANGIRYRSVAGWSSIARAPPPAMVAAMPNCPW